jgi:hypothetical protein
MIEPIPDDCLPPEHTIQELLRGPKIGPDGKIVGGLWDGLAPAEVLRDRDEFYRMFPE